MKKLVEIVKQLSVSNCPDTLTTNTVENISGLLHCSDINNLIFLSANSSQLHLDTISKLSSVNTAVSNISTISLNNQQTFCLKGLNYNKSKFIIFEDNNDNVYLIYNKNNF